MINPNLYTHPVAHSSQTCWNSGLASRLKLLIATRKQLSRKNCPELKQHTLTNLIYLPHLLHTAWQCRKSVEMWASRLQR